MQAPFITAKAMGAFAGQGLDVTIDRGTGSQKTIEQVAVSFELGAKPTVAQVFTGAYRPPAADRKVD